MKPTETTDRNVAPFEADALHNHGYAYTTNAPLSSRLANRRLTEVTLELAQFAGRRVLDIGCGDGTYTRELVTEGGAAWVHGADPSPTAVTLAREKAGESGVPFLVCSAYELPYRADSFDLVYLRGVLHHMDRPAAALGEALRVAPKVVVIEPNGYNPGLKLLEKCSKYHIEHGEKSYPPARLDRWVGEHGGTVVRRRYAGFVAMFSPDWAAKAMKRLEPAVERLPLVRNTGCAIYGFTAQRVR